MANKKKRENDTHFEDFFDTQTIVDIDIEQRMKDAFIDYAMSVIISRALPDVRDGLKPVHRRILYSMDEEHLTYDKPFFKSATTVGNVIGRYHPHGDASVYDAMVRLAQDFSMRYPLIDGHGNFGSVDGDPPAAYRYTEARMSKLADLMLENLDKNTVDFAPNFDEKRKEPTVLPTRLPMLLLNGSSGIAVGMATNIPPHNLTEVIDGVIAQMDNPDITVEELMEYIQGPDFPTYGTIMGKSGIRSAYNTGRGRVIVRAKTEIVENRGGSCSIVITELPYQVNKKLLVESIANLVKDKKIEGLSDIEDHSSDREGIRLEISLKRDANPQVVLNQLFKLTRLQDSFSINMLAIHNGQPKTMGLKEIIKHFIDFQEEIVTRRTQFDLDKALARMHILEGLRIALDNIDEIIHIIRNAYDDAKEKLMERFGFTDIQAKSVLDMRLAQLQRLNGEKIEEEYNELTALANQYRAILADKDLLYKTIKEELTEIRDKYGDERRTDIEPSFDAIEDEDLIEEEEVVITMTNLGYVKRLPTDTYKQQRRGGKGIKGTATKEEDFVKDMFICSTHANILFFSTKGRMYKIKGYRIPEAGRQAKGTPIINIIPIEQDEKITAMIPVEKFEDDKNLVFVTKKGVVKRTELVAYDSNRKGGLNAIVLDEDDELIRVNITDGSSEIILGTHEGMVIRFDESQVRQMGRVTRGVRGINLAEGDYIVGASVTTEEGDLLAVTENGYGKRTALSNYRIQSRGGKGLKNYKISDTTGKIVGISIVDDEKDVLLITDAGVIIRIAAGDLRTLGRNTRGVRLMRLNDGVSIVSMAICDAEEDEEKIKPDNELIEGEDALDEQDGDDEVIIDDDSSDKED